MSRISGPIFVVCRQKFIKLSIRTCWSGGRLQRRFPCDDIYQSINQSVNHQSIIYLFILKELSVKHTYNDEIAIGRRKQQKLLKLVYRIFTCRLNVLSVSSLQWHDLLTLQQRDRKFPL